MTNERIHVDPHALDEEARRELLSAYLDGELEPETAREVTAWLDENPEALREIEHLRRLWDVLEAYEDEPVPEGFAAGVTRAIRRGGRRKPRGLRLLGGGRSRRPAMVAAAAVLVAALGVVLLRDRSPPAEPVASLAYEVPADLLEDADLLLGLSDAEFEDLLLADGEPSQGG